MSGLILLILRFVLAVSLYAFLGWALLTLWSDLRQQSQAIAKDAPPPIMLFRETPPTQEYHFASAQVTIGRAPGNDIPLDDSTVSTLHTRLIYRQNQWWAEDLASTNGTFLNGDAITTTTVLTTGDLLGCGEISLLVSIAQN